MKVEVEAHKFANKHSAVSTTAAGYESLFVNKGNYRERVIAAYSYSRTIANVHRSVIELLQADMGIVHDDVGVKYLPAPSPVNVNVEEDELDEPFSMEDLKSALKPTVLKRKQENDAPEWARQMAGNATVAAIMTNENPGYANTFRALSDALLRYHRNINTKDLDILSRQVGTHLKTMAKLGSSEDVESYIDKELMDNIEKLYTRLSANADEAHFFS